MSCRLMHNLAVYFINFCPRIFHAPGPLPCRPRMCAAEIPVFPAIDWRHFQIMIMNICQHLLMCPFGKRTVSCYPPVCWYKRYLPSPHSSHPPAGALKAAYPDGSLYNILTALYAGRSGTTWTHICYSVEKASVDGRPAVLYPVLY